MTANAILLRIAVVLATAPAWGQQMYKCPNAAGIPVYQQMPCSPIGGGETVTVKKIPMSGINTQLDEQEQRDLRENRESQEAREQAGETER